MRVWVVALIGCGRLGFDEVDRSLDDAATVAPCSPCTLTSDCSTGQICGATNKCEVQQEIVIDWLADCVSPPEADLPETWRVFTTMPAGAFRARSVVSSSRYCIGTDPACGFIYDPQCFPLDLNPLSIGAQPTLAELEAMIPPGPIDLVFTGGDLRCGIGDSNCGDNVGENRVRIEQVCP